MKITQNYEVVLEWEGKLPAFETRVEARSPQSAEQIAMYDAVNNGWPSDWSKVVKITVKELA